jgi:hypothetical protein
MFDEPEVKGGKGIIGKLLRYGVEMSADCTQDECLPDQLF